MVWTTRRSVAVPAWQTRSVVGAGVCTLALAALLAPAAFAQRGVISIAPDSPFSQAYTQSWMAEPWRLEWSEPWLLDGSPASNPVFTADGRYLVYPWPGGAPTRLRIQDIVTRGVVELPVPFLPVRAHPRVPAVFGMLVEASSGWTAARLDPGVSTWPPAVPRAPRARWTSPWTAQSSSRSAPPARSSCWMRPPARSCGR